jgi:hypothetical protein
MTITFENDNDLIVYALEKIISYVRNNHSIFLAQSIWRISSIIGLQEGLIIHIDNLEAREISNQPQELSEASKQSELLNVHRNRCGRIQSSAEDYFDLESESPMQERQAIGRINRQTNQVMNSRKWKGWGDDVSAAMRILKHRKISPQFS